ncbi:MAG: helix-turn-helix transcriptional regulator [Aureispira sp.]|nr:helix-turn-helix transcriptional regulator [Aureispira sp.]
MLKQLLLFAWLTLICIACNSTKSVDSNFYKSIGEQIRESRIDQNISQEELAEAVGLTQNSLSLIEDGLATPIHDKILDIQYYLETEFVVEGKKIEAYLK